MGWTGRLVSIQRTFLTNKTRKLDPRYAAAEFLWYFTAGNLDMISYYAPQYKNFAEDDGTINGAYGPRLMSQYTTLIELLGQLPNTRRAVIGLWTPRDLDVADYSKDVPCTLSYQFIIDDGKLNMIATMRSNDAWLGFPYDVFVNTCIQRLIAGELVLEPGWYQHQVGSMHIYEKDVANATLAYDEQSVSENCFYGCGSNIHNVSTANAHERAFRIHGEMYGSSNVNGFVKELLYCVTEPQKLQTKVLKDAYIRRHGLSWQDDTVS